MATIEQDSSTGWPSPTRTKPAIFSVDDHVLEHPEVWTSRLSAATWGDRIPRLERDATTGTDFWVIDGRPFALREIADVGAVLADRAAAPARWEDVGAAAYSPEARLVAMDVDGVSDSVLYPQVAGLAGQRFGSIPDAAFERDLVAAYNDYIIDEWVSKSPRFVGQAIVPVGDVALAVAEIERAVGRGHRGLIFPGNPALLRSDLPHVNNQHWDPVWRAASELGVPVAFHSGSSSRIELPAHADYSPERAAALEALTRPASSAFLLSNLLGSGILLRFPSLKVVFAESTLSYAAFILDTATHYARYDSPQPDGTYVSPVDLFHRQVYVTGWYDHSGFESRYHIGVENILWSTNFPQATSCWPDSSSVVESAAAGVPGDELTEILQSNARSLYGSER